MTEAQLNHPNDETLRALSLGQLTETAGSAPLQRAARNALYRRQGLAPP